MGDRVSIQFRNGEELSPVLYGHWAGKWMLCCIDEFLKKLAKDFPREERCNDPITRREPDAIFPMFITWYLKKGDADDGNYRITNSTTHYRLNDQGHWIVDLKKMERFQVPDDIN